MDKKDETSNIMLASNIMLRSKYERDPWAYIPADMLPQEYSDARATQFLSSTQQDQMKKKLFYAKQIMDKD